MKSQRILLSRLVLKSDVKKTSMEVELLAVLFSLMDEDSLSEKGSMEDDSTLVLSSMNEDSISVAVSVTEVVSSGVEDISEEFESLIVVLSSVVDD